jgi:hypothetical protein
MSFIKSEISKTYLLEEDAVEGFSIAVQNGQTRLALQILSEIIPVFEEMFFAIAEQLMDEEEVSSETQKEEIGQPKNIIEEKKSEEPANVVEEENKKTASKKTSPKQEENKVASE